MNATTEPRHTRPVARHGHLRVEKVGPEGVEAIHRVLAVCGLDLERRRGLAHWNPPYPIELLRNDAGKRDVYGVFEGLRLVGTFTVGTSAPRYYGRSKAAWDPRVAAGLYLARLAVLPPDQARGIGSRCLATAEDLARRAGCGGVRLDACARDRELLAFYERRGYAPRGEVEVEGTNLVLLEKVL